MTRWTPLLLALCACGPKICDYPAEWADSCGVPWTEADHQTCRDNLSTCRLDEKKKLEAFWLCMDAEGFFECRDADTGGATGEPAGAQALLTCQPELRQVPIRCAQSIGITGGSFAGLESESTTTTATP